MFAFVFVFVCFSGLFGEGPAERRERLRHLLAALGELADQDKQAKRASKEKAKEDQSVSNSRNQSELFSHQV